MIGGSGLPAGPETHARAAQCSAAAARSAGRAAPARLLSHFIVPPGNLCGDARPPSLLPEARCCARAAGVECGRACVSAWRLRTHIQTHTHTRARGCDGTKAHALALVSVRKTTSDTVMWYST